MNEAQQEFTNWLLTMPPEDAAEIAEIINKNPIADAVRWHDGLTEERIQ